MSKLYKPSVPSFATLIHWEGRKAWPDHAKTAWALDHKVTAYAFAEDLGLAIPRLSTEPMSFTSVPLRPGTVVKPLGGVMSTGVFLVQDSEIVDLGQNESLDTEQSVRSRMQELLDRGRVQTDEWIVERLVRSDHDPSQPARDLKFYCFYGTIGLMLETVRRPEVKRCWYSPDGARTKTGKYADELFGGFGIPDPYIEAATRVSLEVPSPFVRVDFLASPEGPVFNEITPKPGGSHLLDRGWAIRLGNRFLAAARRLHEDLLGGRSFDVFLRHAG